jgi:hypothetical protein
MRRSWRSVRCALAALMVTASGALPAMADDDEAAAATEYKNLNTIPEDGFGDRNSAGDSAYVKAILAARPNEDLVICIAGCFSGRDRVVDARPSPRPRAAAIAPQAMLRPGQMDLSGTSVRAETGAKAASVDAAPVVVINGAN